MPITIHEKTVWGNDLLYIQEESIAAAVQGLTGKKTVNESDVLHLQSLGFEVSIRRV